MRLMNMADHKTAAAVSKTVSGFAEGTAIRTEHGARAVETLAEGDKVITRYGKPVAINRIVTTETTGPLVHVAKNAFSQGTPRREMLVAPDQMIMLTAPVLEWLYDCTAALLPIRHLTCLDGVQEVSLSTPVRVLTLELDAPRIIFGSGLAMATRAMWAGHPIKTLNDTDVALLHDHIDELVAAV